jgi:hypothetical protein
MNVLHAVMGPTLEPGVVYRAPSGRLCRLAPLQAGTPSAAQALLLYCSPEGKSAPKNVDDGFTLSRFNWYLLREVG